LCLRRRITRVVLRGGAMLPIRGQYNRGGASLSSVKILGLGFVFLGHFLNGEDIARSGASGWQPYLFICNWLQPIGWRELTRCREAFHEAREAELAMSSPLRKWPRKTNPRPRILTEESEAPPRLYCPRIGNMAPPRSTTRVILLLKHKVKLRQFSLQWRWNNKPGER
jgi:hypothetical protein